MKHASANLLPETQQAEAHTEWISKWALYSPKAVMLQDDETGSTITYGEANRMMLRTAAMLQNSYGVKRGDRVAVLALNHIEYVVLFFAIQKLGAIMVPLNYRLAAPELAYQFEDSAPSVLLLESDFVETIAKTGWKGERILLDTKDGFVARMYYTSPDDEIEVEFPENTFGDTCMILYTSGTTGRPKGAMITNGMLFWNSVNTGLRLNLVQSDITLTFAPFFHTGGWNVLTTPFIHRGAKLILLRKFDPERVLELCDSEKVSILFGVPTMMDMLYRAKNFASSKLEELRYAIVGGEPMPVPLIEAWQDKGVPIRQGYGLTEFGPNVFSLNEEDAIRKKGSIGFPNFYIEAAVRRDDGTFAEDNEPGELVLRGPVCMKGYWNKPEETEKTMADGWLLTGDIVKRDEEGYFYVIDRKKEMFISGAENVYPAEVEHVFRTHPGIREVAIIGVPDPKWGETGKAFIVLQDGENASAEELMSWARTKLAKYKVPSHYAFIDELPKSDSGKILKRKLKEA